MAFIIGLAVSIICIAVGMMIYATYKIWCVPSKYKK